MEDRVVCRRILASGGDQDRLRTARDYPRIREQFSSYAGQVPGGSRDENFRYGLDRVLDGIAAALPARP